MKCKLCHQNDALVDSHIIPKFVFDWLKKSGTGRMRRLSLPNKPIQDGIKVKLLCSDCEIRFGVAETYFSKKIFYPIINQEVTSFNYDKRLQYFVASIFWRLLKDSLLRDIQTTKWYKIVQEVENQLWEYLWLDKKNDIIGQIQLLVGVNLTENQDIKLDEKVKNQMILYFARGIDASIPHSEDKLFLYLKLPRMIFLLPIHKYDDKIFFNSNIKDNGKFVLSEVIFDDLDFSSFLLERVNQVIQLREEITENQKIKSYQNYLKQKEVGTNNDFGKIYQYLRIKL